MALHRLNSEFKMTSPEDTPHRRFNPLTADWVLVSPHRAKRPWQGAEETVSREEKPLYDEKCYLCPGNERMGGALNPAYTGPYVFKNDFAALLGPEGEGAPTERGDELFREQSASGECRVICFSPRHDLSLPQMEVPAIRGVVDLWVDQAGELGKTYQWVQIFENKGEAMGCSNPHPHGQIWASDYLPNEASQEDFNLQRYYDDHGRPLLLDYVRSEIDKGERVIVKNEDWVVVVPYWATWPFETLLLPRSDVKRLTDLNERQRDNLAAILKRHLTRYDNLFECSFPYSIGWHGAPFLRDDTEHWTLHAHFYPPLLRSASVKKFMVGYEMLANAQRDLTPEQAAARLIDATEVHYTRK